jgi:hypothetical protein
MPKRIRSYQARVFCASVLSLAAVLGARAQAPADAPPDPPLTVAVLGFEAPGDTDSDIGSLINDTVEVMLSGDDRFKLVDRSSLAKTLEEQGLNLSGATDTSAAISTGKVVGAKLLVTGKAFELGQSRMITAKVIGTETTMVEAVMAKGELDKPLDELVFEVAEKLAVLVQEKGPTLVAAPEAADPVPALIERLKGKDLPVFAIVIPEEHRRAATPIIPPDPAVETELKKLLIQAGAEVQDVKDNALADWVKDYKGGDNPAWPRTLEGVEVIIVGEAFSESAGTLGSLRLASARAEINAITRKDGKIIHADRATTRAVDLAEEVAGKTALEKAGRVLGVRLLDMLINEQAGE